MSKGVCGVATFAVQGTVLVATSEGVVVKLEKMPEWAAETLTAPSLQRQAPAFWLSWFSRGGQ